EPEIYLARFAVRLLARLGLQLHLSALVETIAVDRVSGAEAELAAAAVGGDSLRAHRSRENCPADCLIDRTRIAGSQREVWRRHADFPAYREDNGPGVRGGTRCVSAAGGNVGNGIAHKIAG